MRESKLLGTLLPTSPDFFPVAQAMRRKYGLREVSPDDDPIEEVFLEGEPVPLPEFLREIEKCVADVPDLLPPEKEKLLTQIRKFAGKPLEAPWLDLLPSSDREGIISLYELTQDLGNFWLKVFGQVHASIAKMLYVYLLTGETEEVPKDWISKVEYIAGANNSGEPMIIAMASQIANPEGVVQAFRQEYKKRFGVHHPKISPQMVSTAYYMQLQRAGKPWKDIVAEFIDRNGIQMPRQQNSHRYAEIWQRCENRLRKRMQRCETVLSILLEDKK